jgi:distribution and morphology protein 12
LLVSMSLDLSWALLDEDFTSQLRTSIDKVLSSASKPAFIGSIHLAALHLGNDAPEVSIVDIGDVWQGFLEKDEVPSSASISHARSHRQKQQQQQQQHSPSPYRNTPQRRGTGIGSVSATLADSPHDHLANFAERNLPFTGMMENGSKGQPGRQSARGSNRLHTYRQYSDSGNAHLVETGSMSHYDQSIAPSIPPTPASSHWGPGLLPSDRPFPSSHGNNAGGYFSAWQGAPSPSISSRSAMPMRKRSQPWQRSSASVRDASHLSNQSYPPLESGETGTASQSSSALPSLQLHLSLHWNTSSIRMTINTSLLINHPSPAFMSLPLSITITGLVLQAGGLLAFEVDQATNARRGHFCLVVEDDEDDDDGGEDEDEDGEEGEGVGQDDPALDIDIDEHDRAGRAPASSFRSKRIVTPTTASGTAAFGVENNVTAGERILSSVSLETSVGQADKHVLRFVISLVRKAIGDEVRMRGEEKREGECRLADSPRLSSFGPAARLSQLL